MGKRKLEMNLIEDKSKRHTTFTKRRQGLQKKALKLFEDSVSAGAVIVFSQAGNCYVFGHPQVDQVLRRYVAESSSVTAAGFREEAAAITEAQWRICEELNRDGWGQAVQRLGPDELILLLADMERIERKFTALKDSPEVQLFVGESSGTSPAVQKQDGNPRTRFPCENLPYIYF